MKEKIKYIHCADIHLGANPFEIEERFEDMGKAFEQVCEFAITEKVDFILISGDFFHNKVLNPKTLEQAINTLEKIKEAEIPVFLTEGNHDMETYSNIYSWLQFLSSRKLIYLLRPNKSKKENSLKKWDGQEGSIYQTEDVNIIGLGYPGSTASKYIEKISKELEELISNNELGDKPIICMLHTGINRFLTEAMGGLREEEIASLLEKIDYLALGHIHKRYENKERKYYNPGSVECVRITENPFNRGFYYVVMNTQTKEVETEFKLVKTRNSIILDINIEEIEEEKCEKTIIEKLKQEYEEKCEPNSKIMLQIKINGVAIQGTKNINTVELKEKISNTIPVLHQEIINLIRYVSEDEIIVTNDISREEIDKIVFKKQIEKSGFREDEIDEVYHIIEKIKEYGEREVIDIEGAYGEEIERMLLELVNNN
ncbi:MAG: exonuclease SbcCD subunit D [Clostridia bacterium]|nr:exonuclease SbcCD subunit D [Clostridia bacterium]